MGYDCRFLFPAFPYDRCPLPLTLAVGTMHSNRWEIPEGVRVAQETPWGGVPDGSRGPSKLWLLGCAWSKISSFLIIDSSRRMRSSKRRLMSGNCGIEVRSCHLLERNSASLVLVEQFILCFVMYCILVAGYPMP